MRPQTRATPAIILSGLSHREDFRILDESKSTKFIDKPFQIQIFDKLVKDTFLEKASYKVTTEKMGSILEQARGDEKKIVGVIKNVLQSTPNAFQFIASAGKFLSAQNDLGSAEKVLKIALRLDPKSVTIMSELAKVYHRQNRTSEAFKLLERAQQFSPDNIERLCQLGEVGLSLQDVDKARGYFKKALDIDEDNIQANAGITLSDNIEEHLSNEGKGSLPVNQKLASTCNIVGITYVRNKKMQKGIEQYEAAMAFTHDKQTTARLQFNLGMAYLRSENFGKALKTFEKAAANAGPDFDKAAIYAQKIKDYEAGGSLKDLIEGTKNAEDTLGVVAPKIRDDSVSQSGDDDSWEEY